MASSGCPHCADKREFDAQLALVRLARKQEHFGRVMQQFMSIVGDISTGGPADALDHRARLAVDLSHTIDRIVGGSPTSGFPDCCLVGRASPNGTINWFCSGVLIHPQLALTAGHCFLPNEQANVVALGASSDNNLQNAELVKIRRLAVHPRYQQTHCFSDMTVIVLRQPATTQPAVIATTQELVAASKTMLVGFGNDDVNSTKGFGIKREVTVDIVSIRRAAGDDLDQDEHRLGYDAAYEFVAGDVGFDTCNGDSGGPAYIDAGGIMKVAGLTSRATDTSTHNCGDGGGIYTRIDVHVDFIRQVAADAGIEFS